MCNEWNRHIEKVKICSFSREGEYYAEWCGDDYHDALVECMRLNEENKNRKTIIE